MHDQRIKMVAPEEQQHEFTQELEDSESQSASTQNVRFIYNASPCTKQLIHSSAIPNAVHYTPFHYQIDPEIYNEKDVQYCKKCGGYFNKHCEVIKSKKLWICCICKQGNNLTVPVVQVEQTFDIVCEGENVGSSINKKQKLYMFLIDLCVSAKEMEAIKEALLSFIEAKAHENYENVNLVNRIAIITYSKFVYCYELASQLNTLICIGGDKAYDLEQIYKFLAISPDNPKEIISKYFVSIKANKDKISRRVKKIKAQGNVMYDSDPQRRCRAKRVYGQALSVALSICEGFSNQCRIVSLIGGPCTHGVGMTIGTNFKQQMRSISEHEQGQNVHYFESASKFYTSLKARASGRRTVLDFFIFSVEETGLAEMYDLVRSTGGLLVLGEQFSGQLKVFEKSFKKAYVQTENNQMICSMSTSCFITVSCSSDIKINGLLGPCKPIQSTKGRQYVSDKVIGFGDTNFWYLGAMNCYRTLTFMLDLAAGKAFQSSYCIQFKTSYRDYWGFKKVRVTTVRRQWEASTSKIADGFDQSAAIVMLAKWFLYKYENEPKIDLRKWVDKLLVKWASLYSSFAKQDPSSFTLPEKMKYLPQFIYHFRRNPLCLRQGLSLDDLTYHIHILNSETVQHCLTIIQPSLLSYTIQNLEPTAVRLQQQQMKKNAILLLDTHFYVLLWYGEDIEYWEKEEYYKKKQYEHVKNLMEAPAEVVKYLVSSRWPYPGYYKTSPGHSKQRILKSKVSPSLGQHSQNTLTDDKSSYTFMKVLREIIVNGKPSQN